MPKTEVAAQETMTVRDPMVPAHWEPKTPAARRNWHANRSAGARWCPEHHKWECTKMRTNRLQCHQLVILGTFACKNHGGKAKARAQAEGRATITAWSMAGVVGVDESEIQTISQTMAVKSILQMTWLRLSIYSELLRQQVAAQAGVDSEQGGVDAKGSGVAGADGSGLIGHKYAYAGGEHGIGLYETSEEIRALVALEATERDRVVKYAKTAHDMGIAEREQTAIEHRGNLMGAALLWFLRRQGLDRNDQARDDLARMLIALDSGDLAQLEIGPG